MRMKTAVAAAALAIGWMDATQAVAAEACASRPLAGADLAKMDAGFRKNFCAINTSPKCDQRWTNASGLLSRLIKDPRVQTVGTAAYIAATVYVETGTKDFDPATVETLGPAQLQQTYAKQGFYGRGWIQLTHKDKYKLAGKKLGVDLVAKPDRAREPDISYEILVRGMLEGWLETYRSSAEGNGGTAPIPLGDFVTPTTVDYGLARAVINANCKNPCARTEVRPGQFLPPSDRLDAGPKAKLAAERFEMILCSGLPAVPTTTD